MASRRPLSSALCRLSAAAARPATCVLGRPHALCPVAAARQQQSRTLYVQPSSATLSRHRWYSSERSREGSHSTRAWTFDEIKEYLERKDAKDVVIVDVREPVELFETGKIPGAINIPITTAVQSFHISEEDFQEMYGFDRPPKKAELLFYCKAGVRARSAATLAKNAGWEKVGEYSGSWLDWAKHNGPVEKV